MWHVSHTPYRKRGFAYVSILYIIKPDALFVKKIKGWQKTVDKSILALYNVNRKRRDPSGHAK